MKTDKITVADLFEKQRRYLVPLFQRGFVWTLDGQLKPLWRDILEQAQFLAAQRGTQKKTPRKHFLGAVVFNQVNPGVRHVPISEVIDGQQRLTTLQLLLVAFRDAVAGLDNRFLSAKLERLTENEGPYPDETERFKVWPTNAFRDDLQGIVTAGSLKEIAKRFPRRREKRKWSLQPLLVQGYLFFHEAISRYLKGVDIEEEEEATLDELDRIILKITKNKDRLANLGDTPLDVDRAELLLETVIGHIQLVEISLESEDDPQIIFETLNARGAPLQPSDLVRNFVFLYATRHGEDVNQIYDSYWKEFEEAPALVPKSVTGRFWKDLERQGRFRSARIDLLLFHYVTWKTANEIKLGHIFQEFREWWEDLDVPRVAAIELNKLRTTADVFRVLCVPSIKTRFGLFAYRLKMLDTTTIFPLVLYLAEQKDRLGDEEFEGILQDLESYLIRRAACDLTSKNYNKIFLSLLQSVSVDNQLISRKAIQTELLSLKGDSQLWPDDALFSQNWMNAPLYDRWPSNRTRMVLEALEAAVHTTKQEYFPIEDPLSNPLTIEHVMPQWGNEEHWPPPKPREEGFGDVDAIYRRRQLMHSMGNLTLLTQPLNSSVSNGPFKEKRKEIARQSRLQLNAYFQQFNDESVWDEDAIGRRGNKLFQLAKQISPYPGPLSSSGIE